MNHAQLLQFTFLALRFFLQPLTTLFVPTVSFRGASGFRLCWGGEPRIHGGASQATSAVLLSSLNLHLWH